MIVGAGIFRLQVPASGSLGGYVRRMGRGATNDKIPFSVAPPLLDGPLIVSGFGRGSVLRVVDGDGLPYVGPLETPCLRTDIEDGMCCEDQICPHRGWLQASAAEPWPLFSDIDTRRTAAASLLILRQRGEPVYAAVAARRSSRRARVWTQPAGPGSAHQVIVRADGACRCGLRLCLHRALARPLLGAEGVTVFGEMLGLALEGKVLRPEERAYAHPALPELVFRLKPRPREQQALTVFCHTGVRVRMRTGPVEWSAHVFDTLVDPVDEHCLKCHTPGCEHARLVKALLALG